MDYLTVKETAQLLRVSPITVRRYIASGQLAAERVGRGIRVRREAIEEFVTPVVPGEFYWPRRPANYEEEDLVEICSRSSPTGVMWVLIDRLDDYLDQHVPVGDDPLGNIIGLASGTETGGGAQEPGAENLPTVLHALGVSAGIFRTGQPTNIAEHKDEYLAEAFDHKG
jgi:excisionase family DNA binding protein